MPEICRNMEEVFSSRIMRKYEELIGTILGQGKVAGLLENRDLFRRAKNTLSSIEEVAILNRIFEAQIQNVLDLLKAGKDRPADSSTAISLASHKSIEMLQRIMANEKLRSLWSASVFDFFMAANNAFCTEEYYSLPGAVFVDTPIGKCSKVTHEENPIFFSHLVSQASRQSEANFQRLLNEKAAIIQFEYYREYLELLQALARVFKENPEKYREDLSDIASAAQYFMQEATGKGYNDMIKPMLLFANGHSTKFTFQLPGVNKYRYNFDLGEGGKVLIPGTGIASLAEIEKFAKQSEISFELNDVNGYVADTLQKLANLYGAENINSTACGMEDLDYEKDSINLIILSLIQNAGPSNLAQFAERAHEYLKDEGTILVYSPDEKTAKNQVNTQDLITIFLNAGFKVVKSEKINIELFADTIANPHLSKDLLSCSAEECLERGSRLRNSTKKKHGFTVLSIKKRKAK